MIADYFTVVWALRGWILFGAVVLFVLARVEVALATARRAETTSGRAEGISRQARVAANAAAFGSRGKAANR